MLYALVQSLGAKNRNTNEYSIEKGRASQELEQPLNHFWINMNEVFESTAERLQLGHSIKLGFHLQPVQTRPGMASVSLCLTAFLAQSLHLVRPDNSKQKGDDWWKLCAKASWTDSRAMSSSQNIQNIQNCPHSRRSTRLLMWRLGSLLFVFGWPGKNF